MATRRLRVEFIRFALLLTITVALISVATRHDNHGSGRNDAARGNHPAATGSPSTGATSAPSSAGTTPSAPATSPSSEPAGGGSTGSGGGSGPNGGGASGSGSGEVSSVPTLPRTGGTQVAELAALAVLCICVGSLGMRISRPRPSAYAEEPPATEAAQSAHALGSSVSNRPGTS